MALIAWNGGTYTMECLVTLTVEGGNINVEYSIEEVVPKIVPLNTEIFIQYDKPSIKQLYSTMTNAKGSLVGTIVAEKQYREKAERLLIYLQKKYDLK